MPSFASTIITSSVSTVIVCTTRTPSGLVNHLDMRADTIGCLVGVLPVMLEGVSAAEVALGVPSALLQSSTDVAAVTTLGTLSSCSAGSAVLEVGPDGVDGVPVAAWDPGAADDGPVATWLFVIAAPMLTRMPAAVVATGVGSACGVAVWDPDVSDGVFGWSPVIAALVSRAGKFRACVKLRLAKPELSILGRVLAAAIVDVAATVKLSPVVTPDPDAVDGVWKI